MSLIHANDASLVAAVRCVQLSPAAIPILVSVPHAGRIVPDSVNRAARVPLADLGRLSDRWADLLAAPLVERGATAVIARLARAVADCNRHESEMDPVDVAPSWRQNFGPPGRKARAGLGVVPARLPGCGALWQRPLTAADMEQRLAMLHHPFHALLTENAAALHRRFGCLLLIDLHSMPSLPVSRSDPAPAQIVIGDRFGRSAVAGLATDMAAFPAPGGARIAINRPYAGGYILDRHGDVARSIHAIQVEFDRRLYLDATGQPQLEPLWQLGQWLADAAERLVDRIVAEALPPLAAE